MFEEDTSIFFEPTGLGDTAIIDGGGDMYGIFERQYAEIKEVEGYYPTFLCSDDDAENITKDVTSILLQNVEYTALSKRPDGTGMTLLILEKV